MKKRRTSVRIEFSLGLFWAAGWLQASIGMLLSEGYEGPGRGYSAQILLGLAGWASGGGRNLTSLTCTCERCKCRSGGTCMRK